MSSWESGRRPITIAILAMGGEGGGVLSNWIVDLGEASGYTAQSTSVAGVAQRTGATVYYVELYPDGDAAAKNSARSEPILSLFPTPGQVDVVIASELMEAGRALQRGFSTPDRTTLISSTNRVYSVTEKMELGDGRVDVESLLGSAKAGSKLLIAADFGRLASEAGSVISASLFGAFAGSGVLPVPRENYEETIRRSGKGVDRSLAAFSLGFDAAVDAAAEAKAEAEAAKNAPKQPSGLGPVRVTIGKRPPVDPEVEAAEAEAARHRELAISNPRALVGPQLAGHMDRVERFPEEARSMVVHGCVRTAVYQGTKYTDLYLDRAERFAGYDLARAEDDAELSIEIARHVALWMSYQDTINVALQKVRKGRIAGVRKEAKAGEGQLTQVREYLHPQIDEIADTLPTALGRWVSNSAFLEKLVGKVTRNGMIVNTTSVFGFTMLRIMASMRPMRPRSLRYGLEQQAIEAWLDIVDEVAQTDYNLAVEVAKAARVLKGYGQTHSHGKESFAKLMAVVPTLQQSADGAKTMQSLIQAALKDEDGKALDQALAGLSLSAAR